MSLPVLISLAAAAAVPTSSAAAPTPAAAAGPRSRVLFYEPKGPAELAPVAREVVEAALAHLSQQPTIDVIGQGELAIVLSAEKDKSDLGACVDEEACLAKLSRSVEAEKVVTGQIGRWGEGYILTLNVADVGKAVVEASESCQSDTREALKACVPGTLSALLGLDGGERTRFSLDLAKGGAKIAVVDLAAYEASGELAGNLTQLLGLELRKFDGVSVISRQEVAAMLEYESSKQILQCKDDFACLAEIGGALGVDYLVMGGIGKLDDTFVIHLKLVDSGRAVVVNRISEPFRGPEPQLAVAMRFATWRLLGRSVSGAGRLSILTEADEASVSIDGGDPKPVKAGAALDGIPAGKHIFALSADGYRPFSQEFYVESDRLTRVEPALVALPKAWYQEWWAWAIIGGAVAGVATTVAVIATDDPQNGTVSVGIERTGQ
jgi:TolB-like protein